MTLSTRTPRAPLAVIVDAAELPASVLRDLVRFDGATVLTGPPGSILEVLALEVGVLVVDRRFGRELPAVLPGIGRAPWHVVSADDLDALAVLEDAA